MQKFGILAAAIAPVFFAIGSMAHGAVLIDLYSANSSQTPATAANFVTGLGATGAVATDISGSTVVGIDVKGNNTFDSPYTSGAISITTNAFSFDHGGTGPVSKLTDASLTTSAASTATISGLSLIPNQSYELFVVADPLFSAANTQNMTLSYGLTTSTTTGLISGHFATLVFNSGAVPLNSLGIAITPTSSDYAGFSAVAIVALPEPASIGLIGISMFGLLARRRKIAR